MARLLRGPSWSWAPLLWTALVFTASCSVGPAAERNSEARGATQPPAEDAQTAGAPASFAAVGHQLPQDLQSELATHFVLSEEVREGCLSHEVQAWPVKRLLLPPQIIGPQVTLKAGLLVDVALRLEFPRHTFQLLVFDGGSALVTAPVRYFEHELRAHGQACAVEGARLARLVEHFGALVGAQPAQKCKFDRGVGSTTRDCVVLRDLQVQQQDRIVYYPRQERLVSLALSTGSLDVHHVDYYGEADPPSCLPVIGKSPDEHVVGSALVVEPPHTGPVRVKSSGSGCYASALLVASRPLERSVLEDALDETLKHGEPNGDH